MKQATEIINEFIMWFDVILQLYAVYVAGIYKKNIKIKE